MTGSFNYENAEGHTDNVSSCFLLQVVLGGRMEKFSILNNYFYGKGWTNVFFPLDTHYNYIYI